VEEGESQEGALHREVKGALDLRIRVGPRVASVNHAYSHFTITLHVYRCDPAGGVPKARSHTALKWVFPSQFGRYAFPGATRKMLECL
jgi:A/G-specific adenine glycosylase